MSQSEFKNVKRSQLIQALERLTVIFADLEIKKSTKHHLKLCHPNARRNYPLSINGNRLAEWVVDGVEHWLCDNKICTKSEFREALRLK